MEYTTYQAQNGQSLLDLAIQFYGDIQGIYWILQDNPQLQSMIDNIRAGDKIKIRASQIDKQVVAKCTQYGVFTLAQDRAEGIGFWKIGADFSVSWGINPRFSNV